MRICVSRWRPNPAGLSLGVLDGLGQDLEDEVDVFLRGVDAHQADAPNLAGSWAQASGDLQQVPGNGKSKVSSDNVRIDRFIRKQIWGMVQKQDNFLV